MYISYVCLFCFVSHVVLIDSHYTNEWAVKLNCGPKEAADLAKKHGFQYMEEVFDGIHIFTHKSVAKRSIEMSDEHHKMLTGESKVEWVEQQKAKIRVKRDIFNDPLWPKQWYMNRGENLDMNVLTAYKRFGATGEGVVVTILDDGIEKNHTDLVDNYDPRASYDFNGNDDDPQPQYDFTDFNRHGTRCAGEVAAVANNGKCGVGIAYKAKIGGVRMLDGDVTDLLEARAIAFNNDYIDIYSASWGPTDDGTTLDGPGKLTRLAFENAIQKGRNGLGSIFIWASGNGGRDEDNCNCDGYASLPHTISISSASEKGFSPFYSEKCSSTLATTYSSGFDGDRQISTTDLRGLCTTAHSGTSASAPLGAGIVALALQINRKLTWRDVQHLIVLSSKKGNLEDGDWVLNGAGKLVSHKFGFGLMDAGKLVELAKIWKNVPEKKTCTIQAKFEAIHVSVGNHTEIELEVEDCQENSSDIRYIEHVQSFVTFSSTSRGQTEIFLVSPNGTRSNLVTKRPRDQSNEGFNDWPFMSTHHWGESPRGTWKLVVACHMCTGTLKNWTLVFHGISTDPSLSLQKPRALKDNEKACGEGEFYLDDSCYGDCPVFYYPTRGLLNVTSSRSSNEILNVSMCVSCHHTCAYCRGPETTDCTSCHDGLILSAGMQCVNPNHKVNSYPDIFLVGALCLAATLASIVVITVVAGLLTRYRRRKAMLEDQKEPLLGDN